LRGNLPGETPIGSENFLRNGNVRGKNVKKKKVGVSQKGQAWQKKETGEIQPPNHPLGGCEDFCGKGKTGGFGRGLLGPTT